MSKPPKNPFSQVGTDPGEGRSFPDLATLHTFYSDPRAGEALRLAYSAGGQFNGHSEVAVALALRNDRDRIAHIHRQEAERAQSLAAQRVKMERTATLTKEL